MGVVKAVCVSEVKGVQKHAVKEITLLEDWGVKDDAHAGDWHRQVSLLSAESAQAFIDAGAPVTDGSFGENIVISGFDFKRLPVGTQYRVGDQVILEQTQIGKHCHDRCAIYHIMGDCIMPREGVFTRVLRGGVVRPGDPVIIDFVPNKFQELEAATEIAQKWPEAMKAEAEAKRRDEAALERKRIQEETKRAAEHANSAE